MCNTLGCYALISHTVGCQAPTPSMVFWLLPTTVKTEYCSLVLSTHICSGVPCTTATAEGVFQWNDRTALEASSVPCCKVLGHWTSSRAAETPQFTKKHFRCKYSFFSVETLHFSGTPIFTERSLKWGERVTSRHFHEKTIFLARVAKCQIFYMDQNLQTKFYPEKSA